MTETEVPAGAAIVSGAPTGQRRFQQLASVLEGDGPHLVLLHGGHGSWTHWARVIGPLAAHFQVRALDLPGYGASPDVPAGIPVDDYLDWVCEEILSGVAGPVAVTGFSFGGSVAAAVAPMLGGRLAALSLVAPGGFGEPRGRQLNVDASGRLPTPRDARPAARHNLLGWMLSDAAAADDLTVSLHMVNVGRTRFNSRQLSWQDRLLSDISDLSCPIQMIWGAKDSLPTPSLDHRLDLCRAALPQVRFDIIPGAGHWVQHEQPAAFCRLLVEFLTEAAGRSRVPQAE